MSFEILSGNFAPGRFSRNDATPSRTSAEAPRAKIPRLSTLCASIGSSAPAIRQIICRISATETCDVLSAISRPARAPAGFKLIGFIDLLYQSIAFERLFQPGKLLPVNVHSSACENADDRSAETSSSTPQAQSHARANTKPEARVLRRRAARPSRVASSRRRQPPARSLPRSPASDTRRCAASNARRRRESPRCSSPRCRRL